MLTSNKKRKANREACIPCRQAKSRCDGTSDHAEPCSRCVKLNHLCQRDSEYKRIPKKAKFDELAQQVQYLQSVVDASNAQPKLSSDALAGTTTLPEQTPSSQTLFNPQNSSFPEANDRRLQPPVYEDSTFFEPPHQTTASYLPVSAPDPSYQSSVPFQTRPLASQSQSSVINREINANEFALHRSGTDVLSPVSQYRVESTAQPPISAYDSFLQTDIPAKPRSIGSVSLTSQQISNLFKAYFENYHPFFSILDPCVSPDDYYSRCPLLYWVTIGIASHRCEEDPTLIDMLSPLVQDLLWSTMRKLPHSPFVVEAIILYSMWPFPTSSMWQDPTFILISMAKSSVMQLGLHRPDNIQDFSRVEKHLSLEGVQDSVRIWAACYVSAQLSTSSNGQESILTPDQTIDRACEPNNIYQLPTGLHHHLRLMKFSVHASKLLSENIDTLSGQSSELNSIHVMDRLELEFDELKSELEVNATILMKIYIYCTQLQLRVFYFFEGIHLDKRKAGLQKCFESASIMIEMMVAAESDRNSVIYAPNQMFRMLTVAGIVLMRILNSNYCSMCSLQDNDNYGRGSKILSQLWIHSQNSPNIRENPPSLQIKSRLGASLLHDSLWIWRRKCDDQKSRRSTRQNSPHRAPSQDKTAVLRTTSSSDDNRDFEMHDMLNFNGMESIDMNWLGGTNLLSWVLPGFNTPPQIDPPMT